MKHWCARLQKGIKLMIVEFVVNNRGVALCWAWLVLGWVTVRGYTILVFKLTKAIHAYSAWPSLRG